MLEAVVGNFVNESMIMTEEKTNPEQAAQNLPVVVHAQYVKDLSFENPQAPNSLRAGQEPPQMDINISMDAAKLEEDNIENLYEVALKLSARANRKDSVAFIAEVEYGMTVSLPNVPEKHHHPVLMIEVPRLAFPFARQVLADITQQGGFPPLLLNPVDFHKMYLDQFAEAEKN